MTILSLNEWNNFLSQCPDAHLLQTPAWGELKSSFGWEAVRLASEQDGKKWGAQILFRRLPLGFTLAYLPKGPLDKAEDGEGRLTFPGQRFWDYVDQLCRKRRAVFLKIEPDAWTTAGQQPAVAAPEGFTASPQSIQPPRTIIVDLSGSEDEVLVRMKQKTRYNIRLAAKKGVTVSPSRDIQAFHRLMETTGQRDQFGIHSLAYYQTAFDLFSAGGNCILLIAEVEGEPVAGLMAFVSGRRAWYLYGASASTHRERMPTYLLQWEAMLWARSRGCLTYDLYGVPDHEPDYLEANFSTRSDGLWGIYRFKRGFGGQVIRSPGPWDRVYNSLLYRVYLQWAARGIGVE